MVPHRSLINIKSHTIAGFQRLKRLALLITVTLLKDIANAAMMGESRMPKKG
jgi:hypothetical protein